MAKSKIVSKYPAHFHELAAACGQTLEFTFDSPQAAQSFRFDLYGFRRALEAEHAQDMYPDFMRAKVRIVGNLVTVAPPEDMLDPGVKAAIEAALRRAAPVVVEPAPMPTPQVWTPPPPPVDPYEAYMRTPEPTAPPVDPFDLTETRNKIDSFTSAVNAWLAGGEEGK